MLSLSPSLHPIAPPSARARTIRSDITRTEESRSASCRVTQLDLRSPRARACCRLRSRVRARACFHVEGTVFARQFAVSVLRGYRASSSLGDVQSKRHVGRSGRHAAIQDQVRSSYFTCMCTRTFAFARTRARARAPRPFAFPFAVVDFLPFDSRST